MLDAQVELGAYLLFHSTTFLVITPSFHHSTIYEHCNLFGFTSSSCGLGWIQLYLHMLSYRHHSVSTLLVYESHMSTFACLESGTFYLASIWVVLELLS